jgi:hypothetical protein
MAAAESDYHRGDMDIAEQKRTFAGFMTVTVWGSGITAMVIFYLTLVFAAGFHWLPSLIGVGALGVLFGLGLRLKGGWYAVVIVLGAIAFIAGVAFEILNRFAF